MGQYFLVVNLDKREYLTPSELGDGAKLHEFAMMHLPGGTMSALALLLAVGNGRGNGDVNVEDPLVGSWAGDRIAVVGDYAETDDLAVLGAEKGLYDACLADGSDWRDISEEMRRVIEQAGHYRFIRRRGFIPHRMGWRREQANSNRVVR